ncbi:CLUMA_CG015196, isoform A [Clunio marinus]|uniref:CLUMA_CG015196, isoform A n=1 Tax=Clunio marinus TaxID=568069 RepID=A0A1J1IVD3_9DIPT|nr:CLUMA_CG015196, isoform A [Clunio marinus]
MKPCKKNLENKESRNIMLQIINRIPCRLPRCIYNSSYKNIQSIHVLSNIFNNKVTNNQKSQNIQESVLKLNKTENCPPKPPPKTNYTKWMVVGGASAFAAGLLLHLITRETPDPPEIIDKTKIPLRIPQTSVNIPKHVPYLLVGGGTASFAAFRAIKSNEPKAKVMVISDETVMPYMRPPLSKEIWFDAQLGVEKARFKQWNGAERSVYYEPEEFYMSAEKLKDASNGGVSVIRGYSVVKLDINEQKVLLDEGTEITYDKCLIATGSTPKSIDIFDSAPSKIKEKITSFKSIKDFENVKAKVEKSKKIAIVGNGFLGSELACALAHYGKEHNGLKVYQVYRESGNMAKVLPEYLSKWTTEKIKEIGVDVQPNSQISSVEMFEGTQLKLKFTNGNSIIVDNVIQAVGSLPNVKLAQNAGLEIDQKFGGFLVNAELEARSNLYAAGDVACFYDPRLGRRRVEHHDHAVVSGRLAGENMVGLKKPYKHQSMFWSDLGSAVGYEAIGLVDSTLPTVAVFTKIDSKDDKTLHYEEKDSKTEEVKVEQQKKETSPVQKISFKDCPPASVNDNSEDFGKGVVFYMQGEKIVGILLWNVFNRISIARKILMSDETFKDLNEVAKLFDIYDQHKQDED